MIPDTRAAIAVVDDDDAVLESLVDLLGSAGFRALTFSSAGEFLRSGVLQSIACLISDIHMAAMDGWELRSVALTARPDLPVILITGRDESNRKHAQSSDDVLVLRKPFDAQRLLDAIASALQSRTR